MQKQLIIDCSQDDTHYNNRDIKACCIASQGLSKHPTRLILTLCQANIHTWKAHQLSQQEYNQVINIVLLSKALYLHTTYMTRLIITRKQLHSNTANFINRLLSKKFASRYAFTQTNNLYPADSHYNREHCCRVNNLLFLIQSQLVECIIHSSTSIHRQFEMAQSFLQQLQ